MPGIQSTFLAMDTEEGVEVVWNELLFTDKKAFKAHEVRHPHPAGPAPTPQNLPGGSARHCASALPGLSSQRQLHVSSVPQSHGHSLLSSPGSLALGGVLHVPGPATSLVPSLFAGEDQDHV